MKIEKEKKVVELMIRIYCSKKEKNEKLCSNCQELLNYALARLEHCPFGDQKRACKTCRIHCYKPEMRKRIQTVMKYAGPRMILYAPIITLKHLLNK